MKWNQQNDSKGKDESEEKSRWYIVSRHPNYVFFIKSLPAVEVEDM
jgi:hypothetical protein